MWSHLDLNFVKNKINMKKIFFCIGLLSSMLYFTSCEQNQSEIVPENSTEDVVIVSGDITTDMTLTKDKKYLLKGFVFVKDGATLTIEPGTVILGDQASKGTLVITRSGKIQANGTKDQPIVFTSQHAPGLRNAGDWGGIIILGKAPVNIDGGEAKIEGGLLPTDISKEKEYIWYGGSDPNHNSGSLSFVRIEYAGTAYSPDNEINSLTMGGVGNGTKISHIAVYKSGDDAFEWFGGTVNCDHLVAMYTLDDDFDSDFGYSGQVQFGLIHRAKNIADVSGANGFESDNNSNGTTATPQTSAIFSNITIVGPFQGTTFTGANMNYQNAVQIRRNSSISLHNSLLIGFPIGLYIDNTKGEPTSANIASDKLKFAHNIIAGCGTPLKTSAPYSLESMSTWIESHNNNVLPSTLDVKLNDPYLYSSSISTSVGRPDFRLQIGSPALTGASFTGLTGFYETEYVGAFDTTNDWTSGWVEMDADKIAY